MDQNHGGSMETVPQLPYVKERPTPSEVVNTALEEKLASQERTEQEKAAARDEQAKLFRPRGNYLLVKMEVREKTAAGILLPDAKQEIPGHGVVVAVGPAVEFERVCTGSDETGSSYENVPKIKAGDSLFFSRFVGATLEFPDGVADPRYRVMSEDEVYGSWSS